MMFMQQLLGIVSSSSKLSLQDRSLVCDHTIRSFPCFMKAAEGSLFHHRLPVVEKPLSDTFDW